MTTTSKTITREILEQTHELYTGKMNTPEGGYSATYFSDGEPKYWAYGPTQKEAIDNLDKQVDESEQKAIKRFGLPDSNALARQAEAHLRKAGICLLCVIFKHRAFSAIVTIDYTKDIDAAIKVFTETNPGFQHHYTLGTSIFFHKTQPSL